MDRKPPLHLATADGHDRYVPSQTRDIVSAGHEGVYEWAVANLVKEDTTFLDLGCGTGYGSALVAAAGASFDGVDLSPAAIEYAKANYAGPKVRFFLADLMEQLPPPLAPKSYDVILTSEVLEHVVDPFALVVAMRDLLRDDGTCFVGTPNRLWSKENMRGGQLLARSHVMEFTPPALEALLRGVFERVTLMFRVFPEGAIQSALLQTSQRRLVRGALAFAREVMPVDSARYRAALPRRRAHEWASEDIEWVTVDDPRADPQRSVGLAAVCSGPKR